jgi:hypothetical protein
MPRQYAVTDDDGRDNISNIVSNDGINNSTKSIKELAIEAGITDSHVDIYAGMTWQEKNRMDYENKFNMIIMNIFNHVVQYHSDADIVDARDQMDAVLMDSPSGPICCFLKYVYLNDTYRQNLLEMRETFFTNEDDIQLEDSLEVAHDKQIIERIFRFKKIWSQFNPGTKQFIMRSLRGLVLISTKYINLL